MLSNLCSDLLVPQMVDVVLLVAVQRAPLGGTKKVDVVQHHAGLTSRDEVVSIQQDHHSTSAVKHWLTIHDDLRSHEYREPNVGRGVIRDTDIEEGFVVVIPTSRKSTDRWPLDGLDRLTDAVSRTLRCRRRGRRCVGRRPRGGCSGRDRALGVPAVVLVTPALAFDAVRVDVAHVRHRRFGCLAARDQSAPERCRGWCGIGARRRRRLRTGIRIIPTDILSCLWRRAGHNSRIGGRRRWNAGGRSGGGSRRAGSNRGAGRGRVRRRDAGGRGGSRRARG